MSYQTYTTDAIVCGSYDRMTADKAFILFTKDAGMLLASARSVREERSRQRYALQDFSRVRVSLVKGKGGWRIGSVEGITNAFSCAHERTTRAGVVRVIQHLRRYVRGEEPVESVWEDVIAALDAITHTPRPEAVARVEQVFLVRLLATLGYIAMPAALQHLRDVDLSAAAAACADQDLVTLATHIARAEHVSHL